MDFIKSGKFELPFCAFSTFSLFVVNISILVILTRLFWFSRRNQRLIVVIQLWSTDIQYPIYDMKIRHKFLNGGMNEMKSKWFQKCKWFEAAMLIAEW